tara:strand:+ start:68 stop:2197 length:2130 start_codon:yes stop_codon:yes gene_type:complete
MRLLIILFLFLTLNSAKAEVVSPTYVQSVASNVSMPSGIALSPDGTKIFMSSYANSNLTQYSLTTAYEISTLDTSTSVTLNLGAGSDALSTDANKVQGFSFNNDGTKVFAIDQDGKLNAHTLSTPYDISNATQDADDGLVWDNNSTIYSTHGEDLEPHDITFNNDGTKMYLFDYWGYEVVVEYHLSTPFLTSSASLGNVFDLDDVNVKYLQDLRFDDDGTRMYLIDSGTGHGAWNFYVYKLSTGFDTSTATYVGKLANFFDASGGQGTPLGMHFSEDGMKLYQVTYRGDSADKIHEYNLSCPYGIVICEIDATSSVGAQVDFAKNVIHHNTSTVFKRFEWIRRNKNNSNLDNHNVKLNIKNPILASLTNKLQASLGSHSSNKSKNWSYWSHGDISFGRAGDTDVFKPKEIRSSGLLFGADRRVDENKFFGAAIRVGKENVDIISSGGTSLDLESLTLNIYGTNGTGFDALVGVSLLRVDQLLSKELTGERNGKQFFTSIRFKTRNSYGNLNVTPLAKIDYGVTEYSEYTDFGTSTNQNLDIYESHTFSTGGVEAGYIFDSIIEVDEGTLKPLGSLTYVGDWTPTTSYKYKNYSDFTTVTNEIERHSTNNIKGNIGIEAIFKNGTTFSVNYERLQKLNDSAHNDNIYFKFGHISAEDSEFAFNFNPMQNNQTNVNYKKTINGYDVVVSSNYSSNNKIPEYGANIEVSNTF